MWSVDGRARTGQNAWCELDGNAPWQTKIMPDSPVIDSDAQDRLPNDDAHDARDRLPSYRCWSIHSTPPIVALHTNPNKPYPDRKRRIASLFRLKGCLNLRDVIPNPDFWLPMMANSFVITSTVSCCPPFIDTMAPLTVFEPPAKRARALDTPQGQEMCGVLDFIYS